MPENSQETLAERKKRFARICYESRAHAGKSQEYMANGLNISKKTVQNWERGISSPSFFQIGEWFDLLGENPIRYILAYVYPESFGDIDPSKEDEKIEQAIMTLVKQSTIQEKRQLLFLMSGSHGSSWYSLLQLFTAHCHNPLRDRVYAANMILTAYEINKQMDTLICPENVMPDISLLENAIHSGREATINNENGYTTIV